MYYCFTLTVFIELCFSSCRSLLQMSKNGIFTLSVDCGFFFLFTQHLLLIIMHFGNSRKHLTAGICANMVVYDDDVGSTIYEGSDESKSKSGSTDSHGSTCRSSSTTSSSRSAHSATSQSAAAAVSGMLPACRAFVTEDVASAVCASCGSAMCE